MASKSSLLLDEQALAVVPDVQKPVYILEWLRQLERLLQSVCRVDVKSGQKQLVEQLLNIINNGPGPPARKLVAKCMAIVFSVGDTINLFDTVNRCNDMLKSRDDSPSSLQIKLAATSCLGEMYEKLGRMMGRSYEETVQILSKSFKNMESQSRIETMLTFEKICAGMDVAASSCHKEIYRIARACLTDRVMSVRAAAAKCVEEMLKSAVFLYTTELESLTSMCLRALDGADYDARIAVAQLLGSAIAFTQRSAVTRGKTGMPTSISDSNIKGMRQLSLKDALNILLNGFLKGATSFLKGEIIKGGSGVNREVRVGVTHAYVSFVECMGASWLEKNLEQFTSHLLELVANPKASTSHVDAVYSRKCVNFVFRRAFGRLLGEKAQFSALKVLNSMVLKQMNSIDLNQENAKDVSQEVINNQHVLVCVLQEMSVLFLTLGTSIQHLVCDSSLGMIDGLFSVLIHPCQSTRLSAAWALRCACVALPSEANKSIERCLHAFDNMKSSPEAVSGYSSALAAILGGVGLMPLGVPYATGKIVFNTAEDLLRSASQNSRLSIQKSHAGWILIGAIMTLGNSVVKALLPRMLLLWRNSFPRTSKELESEKARGDAFTWQVTLDGRAGALSSIHSFLYHCPELLTDEIATRLLVPVESALAMMTNLSATIKNYGQQLKVPAAMLRFRLYETLTLINPTCFERSFTHMLRFVVWELTLNDNAANTTTSVFTRVCQANSIFHSLVSDHMSIEDQLQPTGAAGSGALEHDPCSLYRHGQAQDAEVPVPLPLGVAVIDAAIELFGILYPHVSTKHRSQLIDHFVECLKVTKYARKEAVLINIYSALLCAMKAVRKLNNANDSITKKENKATEELQAISQQLVVSALSHTSPTIRCASAEVLGRIAQAISDPKFTFEMAQLCGEKLKMSREIASRTGHSLALGCLHKYLGGMDSSRHQHGSVSILLNLAQDSSSPETQMWALHSLALIADTGGPLFRTYVEPSLSLVMKLIATVPLSTVDLRQATGKMLAALITGVGPELQITSLKEVQGIKASFEQGCSLLARSEEHALVQNEAITCFQRLHMFGGSVNLEVLIPVLYRSLRSSNLALRRSAVDCLRQVSQKDSAVVCSKFASICGADEECENAEYGLTGMLFAMLDTESDDVLRRGIKDTLTSVLTITYTDKAQLQASIALCKSILTCDAGLDDGAADDGGAESDDEDQIKVDEPSATANAASNSKWTSRVFAAECVRKILITSPFIVNETGTDLVKHLSDLIRMFFMGATSNSDQLRLEGLLNLETIIDKFAHMRDPYFPTSSILEQFQAQVGAALRPAFAPETDPFVKATACRVCSAWICGNSQGGEDLRRVHTLMVSALENVRNKPTLPDYNESANTLEKLAVLKAWAQVFISSVENGLQANDNLIDIIRGNTKSKNHLLELVKPELEVLSPLWLSVLRDRALIELPQEFSPQLPREGGAFFSNETKDLVKDFYKDAWPPVLLAAAICISAMSDESADTPDTESRVTNFHLVFGLSLEALCLQPFSDPVDVVEKYLKSLWALMNSKWPREVLMKEESIAVELCSVLHRQLVTRCDIRVQKLVIQVLQLIIDAVKDKKLTNGHAVENENGTDENNSTKETEEKSLIMSILEVVFCLLMQKVRVLNSNISGFHLKPSGSVEENGILMAETVRCLELLPDVCPSDEESVSIQPTILYLTTCVLGEYAHDNTTSASVLSCYKRIAGHRLNNDPNWEKYLLSTLAKLLDLAKTGGDDNSCTTREGSVNLLAAITIFLRETPPQLLRIPNVMYPSINLYQQALQSDDDYVRTHSVAQICEVFEKVDRSIATHFIHALAPRILEVLYSDSTQLVKSKSHLEFIVQCVNVLHSLVHLVDSAEKRIQMLTLIVPVLISFLLEPTTQLSSVNQYRRQLHDISLQKLIKIGPQYPQEFRLLMNRSSEMRLKLESAVKNSKLQKADEKVIPASSANSTANTIKLKTDFSNYA